MRDSAEVRRARGWLHQEQRLFIKPAAPDVTSSGDHPIPGRALTMEMSQPQLAASGVDPERFLAFRAVCARVTSCRSRMISA